MRPSVASTEAGRRLFWNYMCSVACPRPVAHAGPRRDLPPRSAPTPPKDKTPQRLELGASVRRRAPSPVDPEQSSIRLLEPRLLPLHFDLSENGAAQSRGRGLAIRAGIYSDRRER
jgi:hypothetical protein